MAAATVLYVLNMSGTLQKEVPGLSKNLQDLGAKATAAKAAAEKLGKLTDSANAARSGLGGVAEGGKLAAEGTLKAAAAFAAGGYALNALLDRSREYHASISTLQTALGGLADSIASTFGPAAADLVDRFTIGLVGLQAQLTSATTKDKLRNLALAWGGHGNLFSAAGDLFDASDDQAVKDAVQSYMRLMEASREAATFVGPTLEMIGQTTDDLAKSTDKATASLEGYIAATRQLPGVRTGASASDLPQGFRGPLTPEEQKHFSGSTGPTKGQDNYVAEQVEETRNVVAGVSGVVGAIQGGTSSILSTLGPIGAMIGAIFDALSNIDVLVKGFQDQVYNFATTLGDKMDTLLTDLAANGEKMLSEIIPALNALPFNIVASLIEGAPQLFAEAIKSLVMIPIKTVEGFRDIFADFPQAFADAFMDAVRDLTSFFGAGRDNPQLQQAAGASRAQMTGANPAMQEWATQQAAAQRGRGNIDKFESGGMVHQTGPAILHRGERVIPAHQVRQMGSQQPSVSNITINVNGVRNVDDLARQIRSRLGPYGVGLSLEPHRGG